MSHPMPNLRWFAIFPEQPQAVVELYEPGDLLARFDIASQLGHIANRRIKGMWIVRHDSARDDILRVHGSVPAEISARFYEDRRHRGR
jgi:hypothetical protein